VKFGELKVGAQFRFFRRGTLLTKSGRRTYTPADSETKCPCAVDVEVIAEEIDEPAPPPEPDMPGYGGYVDFIADRVVLDGTFDLAELTRVVEELKTRTK
jgi:hypothetical protein